MASTLVKSLEGRIVIINGASKELARMTREYGHELGANKKIVHSLLFMETLALDCKRNSIEAQLAMEFIKDVLAKQPTSKGDRPSGQIMHMLNCWREMFLG